MKPMTLGMTFTKTESHGPEINPSAVRCGKRAMPEARQALQARPKRRRAEVDANSRTREGGDG